MGAEGGSGSGTSPGLPLDGLVLPLNVADPYFNYTLSSPNKAPLSSSVGALDPKGDATAAFSVPPGVVPAVLIGAELNHAYVVLNEVPGVGFVSNAVPLLLAP